MTEDSRGHVPAKARWEFDDSVTACFPDMLERSIPQYTVMRIAVADVAREFMSRNRGPVVDLGASRGDAVAPLLEFDAPKGEEFTRSFFMLETAPPMVEALRERFHDQGNAHVVDGDLRRPGEAFDQFRRHMTDFPNRDWSVALSVLTLQFVPINYRQSIVEEVWRRLAPGGAFVVVEKVLGESGTIDDLMVRRYHELKGHNGYAAEEIERKRMALEGVLVPLTNSWNIQLLRRAGFRDIDCFWRWMNFSALLAVKP